MVHRLAFDFEWMTGLDRQQSNSLLGADEIDDVGQWALHGQFAERELDGCLPARSTRTIQPCRGPRSNVVYGPVAGRRRDFVGEKPYTPFVSLCSRRDPCAPRRAVVRARGTIPSRSASPASLRFDSGHARPYAERMTTSTTSRRTSARRARAPRASERASERVSKDTAGARRVHRVIVGRVAGGGYGRTGRRTPHAVPRLPDR
jgi:hypothetical protein